MNLDPRQVARSIREQIVQMAFVDWSEGVTEDDNPFADPGKPPKSRAGRLWLRLHRRWTKLLRERGWQQGELF